MTPAPGTAVREITEPAPLSPRRTQTRERLMAAAAGVFAERGVIGASVEEICEAAGFTRGAFYSNFTDKDALVLALIEAGVAAQYAAAERAIASLAAAPTDASPQERIARTLDHFDALVRSHEAGRPSREGVLVHQELMLHAARVPSLRAPYAAFVAACAAQLSGLIAEAMVAAELEFTVPFDEAIDLLTAAHDHGRVQSLFGDGPPRRSLERMVLAITRSSEEAGALRDVGASPQ